MQPSVNNVKKHYVCIALLNVEGGAKRYFAEYTSRNIHVSMEVQDW